jgi:hypothetical protein
MVAWAVAGVALSRYSWETAELLFFWHLSPVFAPGGSLADDWCRVAATPEYLALPVEAQRDWAARFYDSKIAALAHRLYYDADGFRETFIRASVEAPIRERMGAYSSYSYRDMTVYGYPPRDTLRIMGGAAVLGLALVAAAIVPLFVVASAVRWVIHGFRQG